MSSVYLRDEIYWHKATVDGKPKYQSLKTGNKRVAVSLQKKLDGRLANLKGDKYSSQGIIA